MVYVDDLLVVGELSRVQEVKQQLLEKFQGKDMGEARMFVGFRISRDRDARTLHISQPAHAQQLVGYVDSDYAGDTADRKSTSGFVFLQAGGAVSWGSKKQSTVSSSTTEAEYVAAGLGVREARWFQKLGGDLEGWGEQGKEGGWVGGAAAGPIQLYSDSTSALSLLNNNMISARSKHIDVCYHVAREQVDLGTVVFTYCPTDKMKVDMLTKPISTAKFSLFRAGIGMI